MRRWSLLLLLSVCLTGWALARQAPQSDQGQSKTDQDKSRQRSAEAGESSSRDTRIDVRPPKNDAKDHPNTGAALSEPAGDTASGDVQEMHPWNPYKAAKDNEVGDYYFKLKNYKAALARYEDALFWKDNDAMANFRLGECYQKLNQREEAISHYQAYLKILPEGPESKHAKKALEKLGAKAEKAGQ